MTKHTAQEKKYAVGLFSLPEYTPAYMHPATAYLAGHLKAQDLNVEVFQRDLSTESLEYFLGKETIAPMRDLKVYQDFQRFREAKSKISKVIEEKTKGELSIARNSVTYNCGTEYKSRQGLLDAISEKRQNLYYEFFETQVLPKIEERGLNLVGLAVNHQKQLVPTVVLSSMIKEKYGDSVKVVIGGNIITRSYDILSQNDKLNNELFEHFDYLIHHEGEQALLELIKRLQEGKTVEGVPKLIWKDGGKVKNNLEFEVQDVNRLAPPNFDGLVEQQNHWTPKPVIPYLLGRGCDWSGCAFCDIPAGYDHSILRMREHINDKTGKIPEGCKRRTQNLEKIILEISNLSKKYNTEYFSFGDEELADGLLEEFVGKILKSGLKINWEMYGRIEDLYLDKEFCRKLYDSGCRFIQFGVESASEEVLKKNNKGYEFGKARDVLRNTYEAGIMNHAFLLVGLPGDSLIEASKLVTFLEDSGEHLTTIKPISYKVSKWSPIALHPEVRGINLDKEGTPDLDQNINLTENSGLMSRHKAMDFVKLLELWVAQKHKVNPATSEYIYCQRLFLGRDRLEEFGKSVEYPVAIGDRESETFRSVYNGLREELKQKAYQEKGVNKDRRKRFRERYEELKLKPAPTNSDEMFSLCKEVSRI